MRFHTLAIGALFLCMCDSIAGVYFSPYMRMQLGAQRIPIKGGTVDDFLGVPEYKSSIQYGFASRYSMGFYISHKFSIEFAYNALHSYCTEFKIKTIVGDATGTVYRKLSGYDFLAYAYFPVRRWYFYIGVGASIIKAHYLPVSMHFDGMLFPYDLGGKYRRDFTRPKAVLGLGYYLVNKVFLSVSYGRVFHAGKTLPEDIILYVPPIDFISIGITIILAPSSSS